MRTNLRSLKSIAAAAVLTLTVGPVSPGTSKAAQPPDDRPRDVPPAGERRPPLDREEPELTLETARVLQSAEAVADALRRLQEAAQRERIDHEAEIRERMEQLRQLRIKQVDYQAMLERAALDQDHDRVHAMRRKLVEIEYELQHGQLELEGVMMDREREAERRDLVTMTDRLEYVAGWREVAFDPPQAVMMATQAVVELHMARDDAKGAVQVLEETLSRIEGVGSRSAIRFALKDLYTELGQHDRAIEHMVQVILENASLWPHD
jgi:hypothetical protein